MADRPPRDSAEDRLIARYFKPLATHPGAFGLVDDAAAIKPPPGCDLVLTVDTIVAGVHFLPDDPPDAIARKALRVNLSDLAAKGAGPVGFVMSLALTAETGEAWLAPFAQALGADAELFSCPLFGGDTVRTPGPLTISITAFGGLPHGTMRHRMGAQVGDTVMVSGTVGDAALGLRVRKDPSVSARWKLDTRASDFLVQRYRVPQPRCVLAVAVREHASATMDVSDGLAGDLAKLCRASGVAANIEIARVPLSEPARTALAADPTLIEPILTGGDDYEILACVPPGKVASFRAAAAAAGVAVADIGVITAGEGANVRDKHGRAVVFERPSYSHF